MKSVQSDEELSMKFSTKVLGLSEHYGVNIGNHINSGEFNADTWWVDLVSALPTDILNTVVEQMSSYEAFNEYFMPAITDQLQIRSQTCAIGESQ